MTRRQRDFTRAVTMLIGVAAGAAQAAEDPNSANYLLPGCQQVLLPRGDPSLWPEMGACIGKVDAISFMLTGGKVLVHSSQAAQNPLARTVIKIMCADIPNGVTLEQKVRVVIAYIEAHPNRMHENFNALEAMRAAWPCRE
jgi:hypothetical protein